MVVLLKQVTDLSPRFQVVHFIEFPPRIIYFEENQSYVFQKPNRLTGKFNGLPNEILKDFYFAAEKCCAT